jgi:hypothetical protein
LGLFREEKNAKNVDLLEKELYESVRLKKVNSCYLELNHE